MYAYITSNVLAGKHKTQIISTGMTVFPHCTCRKRVCMHAPGTCGTGSQLYPKPTPWVWPQGYRSIVNLQKIPSCLN